MKKILVLFFLMSLFSGYSQSVITGKIIEKGSKEPIRCVWVKVSHDESDTTVYSDSLGYFSFTPQFDGKYHLSFQTVSHDFLSVAIIADTVRNPINVEMEPYQYNEPIEDLAKQDQFGLTFIAISFLPYQSFVNDDFHRTFYLSFYVFDHRMKLASFDQLGISWSLLNFQWNRFANPVEGYDRYFSFNGSLFLYNRFLITKQKKRGQRGLFMDLGAGYRLPFYFSHSHFYDKNLKKNTRETHYQNVVKYNDFEAMVRLGYGFVNLFGTYRFTSIIKNPYTIEPAKWNIGIEIQPNFL